MAQKIDQTRLRLIVCLTEAFFRYEKIGTGKKPGNGFKFFFAEILSLSDVLQERALFGQPEDEGFHLLTIVFGKCPFSAGAKDDPVAPGNFVGKRNLNDLAGVASAAKTHERVQRFPGAA